MRVRQKREEELVVVGGELETERCPPVIRLVAGYIDLVMDDKQEIQTNIT